MWGPILAPTNNALTMRLFVDRKRYPNAASFPKKVWFYTVAQWTAKWRREPDFIVIGVQKGGTSSMYKYLESHPELKLSYRKQLHFFDKNPHRGMNYYMASFPLKSFNGKYKTGEASPYYIYHPHVPKRIKDALPKTKIIAMLRNPIDRAYSHYVMKVDQGWESIPTFEEAIDQEAQRIGPDFQRMVDDPGFYSNDVRNFSYLSRGHYYEQLKRWYDQFDRDQILVLNSEQFFADPMTGLRKVYDFVGISDYKPTDLKVHNKRFYSPMDPETRERLRQYYLPHNEKLYDLLGEQYDWDEPIVVERPS